MSNQTRIQRLTQTDVSFIRLALIKPDVHNGRFPKDNMTVEEMIAKIENTEAFIALMNDIEHNGIANPIRIRSYSNYYIIVSGFRRWVAANKLFGKDAKIPVQILPKDATAAEIAQVIALDEGGMHEPWEEYAKWRWYKKLCDDKTLTTVDVHEQTGLKKSDIENRFEAIRICDEYLQDYPNNVAPFSLMYEAIRAKEGSKFIGILDENSEVKNSLFKQLSNKKIRDPHNSRHLGKILDREDWRDVFIYQGFEAALTLCTQKQNNGSQLESECDRLKRSIEHNFDDYVKRCQYNDNAANTAIETVSRLWAIIEKSGSKHKLEIALKKKKYI